MIYKAIMTIACSLIPLLGCAELGNIKETTIHIESAELFCRIAGQGTPIVVLHGGPGMNHDYLIPSMWELAKEHQVIFYDQRSSGKSTGVENPELINLETFVKDLESLRKSLNFEKIIVLGHSWGGFLGMNYALAYPDRVEKLILSNSLGSTSESFQAFLQEYTRRMEPAKEELEKITSSPGFAEGDPVLFEKFCKIIFSKYVYNPQDVDKFNLYYEREEISKFFKVNHIFDENLLMRTDINLNCGLNQLKVPTLIIHGDFDPIPCSSAEELNKNIPGSKYVLLKNCGHNPFVEAPEAYFGAIEQFLGN